MKFPAIILWGLASVSLVGRTRADPSSSSYTLAPSVINSGGQRMSGADYLVDDGIGENAGLARTISNVTVAKSGYIGQLYEVVGLVVGADTTYVDEGQTLVLSATAVLDDGTNLSVNPASVSWMAPANSVFSISVAGVITPQYVLTDTPATASGVYFGQTGNFDFIIATPGGDSLGIYAGDGIPDAWQVYYFGFNNPAGEAAANPTGDGHDNLYDYVAGVDPVSFTKTVSDFTVGIQDVPGQPLQRRIVFGPILAGRTYTLQASTTLPGNWTALSGAIESDIGTTRTVTDLNVNADPIKFYRVQISVP